MVQRSGVRKEWGQSFFLALFVFLSVTKKRGKKSTR